MVFSHDGFPIRIPTDRRLLTAPRGFSQFCHVLHRLLVPRHPPNALNSLTTDNWCTPKALSSSGSAPAQGQVVQVTSCLRIFVRHQSLQSSIVSRRRSPDVVSCTRFQCCLTRTLDSSELAQSSIALARASFIYSVVIKEGQQSAGQWAKKDLNFRPHAYQACALTN